MNSVRFGLRAGSGIGFMPPAANVSRKTEQNFVSRSCKAYRRSSRNPLLASRVARHLLHPCLVRMPRDPSQANTATLQVNEEQHVVCHQAAPAQHFDGEEIDARKVKI